MDLWVFGYGSLVWRPAFPYVERQPATLAGYRRRFWQGSPDHRGTVEQPGRVVTLLEGQADDRVVGMAYRVARTDVEGVVARLDHREKAGYATIHVPLALFDGRTVSASVYVAGPGNPCFLGPAPLGAMADQIARCAGPSGRNVDYLLELHEALVALGAPDPHVLALVEAVGDRARG